MNEKTKVIIFISIKVTSSATVIMASQAIVEFFLLFPFGGPEELPPLSALGNLSSTYEKHWIRDTSSTEVIDKDIP